MFYADNVPPATIEDVQELCDRFRWDYNHERSHRTLNLQTHAVVYGAPWKVTPSDVRRAGNTRPRVLVVP